MLQLLSIVLPLIIGVIVRNVTNKDVRFIISLIICIIIGWGFAIINTNGFQLISSLSDRAEIIAENIIIVFGISQFSYYFYENKKVPMVDKSVKKIIQG